MRFVVTAALVLALALSVGAAGEKLVRVERDLNVPSFVAWDNENIIVVLKPNVAVDHARDLQSPKALSNYPDFAPLSRRFDVVSSRPQFPGSDLKVGASSLARHYKVKIGKGTIDEAVAAYSRNPMVERVEKDAIHTLHAEANDTYYKNFPAPEFPFNQWHYFDTYSVMAETAWDTESGDATVVVGILDSGTKYNHSDIGGSNPPGPADNSTNGNIWVNPGETPGDGIDNDGNGYIDDVIGYDFVETTGGFGVACTDADCGTRDNDPADYNGHGTHVSGTVAAITNNGNRVAGVAGGFADGTPTGTANGVKIVPCRIGYNGKYRGQDGLGFVIMSAIAEAMYYMGDLAASGVNVAAINCSFGTSNSGGLGAAADYLLSQDVIICVAAGNSNSSSADYLNARGDCLDVGSTDKFGDPSDFSNYGSWVDIAAPGTEILSTYHVGSDPVPDYIAVLDGTSMSCPHVVGVAALLESFDPSLSAADKISLMINNTTAYNPGKDVGAGIVNARAAMDAIAPCTETTPVAEFSGSPTSGDVSLSVDFTDLSTNNPDTWAWTFGDGGNSSAQNPSYVYTSAGIYTVTLTASNCAGSDGETKVAYITVNEAPCTETTPVADFSGSPTSGDAPLTVNFTDLSTNNPDTWAWTFGDGGNSSAQSPSYEYTSPGTYTVTLTASNCAGSDGETKVGYITVTQPPGNNMHVHDIVVTRESKGPNWNGRGEITIYDQNEQPVANANVTVVATGPTGGTGTAATNGSGVVAFVTSKIKNPSGEWCFEVTNVTHATDTYDSGSNHVTKACESGPVFKSEPSAVTLPEGYTLNQNYPNPFNPSTSISYTLPQAEHVTLSVFNIRGQKIATLADGIHSAGQHTIEWDASAYASGVYLYRLTTSEFAETRKMVLMK
ncbi:MAG: S8 family serine peptidase [candidate division Zixibacteria bacterium]|nr:S8 family serine peptidase [candidate division Zixibacteria bacterium]MDH3937625.1 S8 family serine peptidase [candidate division Zixibacteria bacterium]MDH4035439.1 S8 family serine peptidase [candidate division Zixibacteria bacterium]